jgi:acyl-coenzyme A synthetase/AMP-(fatty) acid ligase
MTQTKTPKAMTLAWSILLPTVGYPKMVLHTQASYPIGHTITGKYWLDLHEDDLHWNLSEMGWTNCQN